MHGMLAPRVRMAGNADPALSLTHPPRLASRIPCIRGECTESDMIRLRDDFFVARF
jgi:hypothetical protein